MSCAMPRTPARRTRCSRTGAGTAGRDDRAVDRRQPAPRADADRRRRRRANSPTRYAYQWQRLIASGWTDINAATGATYIAGNQDLGRRLRVAIVASNEDGSAGAASAPSAAIGASGVNRAATSTSRKGRQRAAAQAAKASKKKKAAAKQKAAARRKSAKPATKVRH